ncbi:MAG: O-antigen ligase family protein [Flavobacteriales bacterium]
MLKVKALFSNTDRLYIIGLSFIAIGLSLSKPLISIGQLILVLAWILKGNYTQRIKAFFNNKTALILILFFVISVLGLINTSNFNYAFTDVKRKAPFFVLPFVLFSFSLKQEQLKLIFKLYLAGILASSFWSIFVKLGGLGITIIDDRDLSRFNSHIRFGLEICIAIFGLGYYYFKEQSNKTKIILVLCILWLTAFMLILHLYTGLLVFIVTTLILMLIYAFKIPNIKYKLMLLLFPILIVGSSGWYINKSINQFYNQNQPLEEKRHSPYGEIYNHNFENDDKENGYYVYRNNADEELEYAWNKVSKIHYRGKDLKGQPMSSTVIRFITSKGEYKNHKAVMNLTAKEIKAIEHGITNINSLTTNAFERRINSTIWEFDNYKRGRDYNGHSTVMRWVYWKTAYAIFKEQFWFGVGTGDIQDAFNRQYEKEKSPLTEKFRLRAHNQFITAFTTYGIIGGLLFIVFLLYPLFILSLKNHFVYLAFILIMLLSMLTEDTLDTQVGITLFVFFNTLLIYNHKQI